MTQYSKSIALAGAIVLPLWNASLVYGDVVPERSKLLANNPQSGDFLGWSVDISNGIVAAGAGGGEYVCLFSVSSGNQIARFTGSQTVNGDNFGRAVTIDNGTKIAVGAHRDIGNGSSSGAVYLFNNAGSQLLRIVPDDGMSNDHFGRSIDLEGQILAVGSWRSDAAGSDSGQAYLYNSENGALLRKLVPLDHRAGQRLGKSIAIDGDLVVVGANNDDENGEGTGAAYIFDVLTGVQLAKLSPTNAANVQNFGSSVAINNGLVIVGATPTLLQGTPPGGAAFVFDATTGTQLAQLLPADNIPIEAQFGSSVSISDEHILIGARRDSTNGANSGAAYLFHSQTFLQLGKLLPRDGVVGDRFGGAVSIDQGMIIVGSVFDDETALDNGSAYFFDTSDIRCVADINGDGILDFFDVSAFLQAFSDGCSP